MHPTGPDPEELDDDAFAALLDFRDGLRRFTRWSDERAREAGVTPAQHQLLLAIRGHGRPASVGEIAAHLLLRHHSAVELVDRAEAAGLVERRHDLDDRRVVRIHLTGEGERHLRELSAAHLEELSRIGPRIGALWRRLPAPRS